MGARKDGGLPPGWTDEDWIAFRETHLNAGHNKEELEFKLSKVMSFVDLLYKDAGRSNG